MSLLDEYADRRERKGREEGWEVGKKEGMKELISCFIDSGESLSEISKKVGMSVSELEDILK